MQNKFNQIVHKLMLGLLAMHIVLPASVSLAAGQITGSYNESAPGMADGQGIDNYTYTTGSGMHDFVFKVDTELADGDYFTLAFPSVMPVSDPQTPSISVGVASDTIDQVGTITSTSTDAVNNFYRLDVGTISGAGNPWVNISGFTTAESLVLNGNFAIYISHYDATDVLKNSGTAVAQSEASVTITARIYPTGPINTTTTNPAGTNPIVLSWERSLTTPLGIDGYVVRWMKKADEDELNPCPESPVDPASETNAPALPWHQEAAVYNTTAAPYPTSFTDDFDILDGELGLYCVEVRSFSKGSNPMISDPDSIIVNVNTYESSLCGDGIVQEGETCDDGNQVDGDGCSALCIREPDPGSSGGDDDSGDDDDDDDDDDDSQDEGDDDEGEEGGDDDDSEDEGDDDSQDEGDDDSGDDDDDDDSQDEGDDDSQDEGDDDDSGSDYSEEEEDENNDVDDILGEDGDGGDDRNGNGIPDWWEEEYFGRYANINAHGDPDNDGLTNRQEYYENTDPTNPDSDDDRLLDGYEYKTSKTNPLKADSDDDGLSDGNEITRRTDPLQFDTDGDTYGDGIEVQMKTDPLDPDSYPTDIDGDGVADSWEIKYFGSINFDEYGKRDYDNDGLADFMEYELGTNPLLQDTDGDNYSDGEEVLDYGTDPLNPDSNPDMMNVMITNWKDGEAAAYSYPVFRGIAPAGSTVEIYLSQDGESQKVSTTLADDARKFVSISEQKIEDGEYILIAVAKNSDGDILGKTNAIHITIDSTLGANSPNKPRIEELEGNFIQEDQDLLNLEDLELTICEQRPVLRGRTSYGSQVHAIWHSLIMSSSVIADSQTGEFVVSPKDVLELGEHEVIVYAEKDGLKSDLIHIPFSVTDDCEVLHYAAEAQGWFNWWWVILSILVATGSYEYYRHHQKKLAPVVIKKKSEKNNEPKSGFHHRRGTRKKRKIEESEEFIV